jgi:hypothetical protein
MKATSVASAFVALAVVLTSAGCATESKADGALGRQVCIESDLGGSYIEKTSGDVSVDNLAALSDNPSAMRDRLTRAGLRGGRFAYWVHTVPKPPFDPPLEVVCQALEFRSDEQAAAFVHDLQPTPDDLASTAIAWLAEGDRHVEEFVLSRAGAQPGTPVATGPRAFKITARGNDVDFTIYASVESDGRFVRTVYVGRNGDPSGVTWDDAASVAMAIEHRLGE